MLKQIIIKNFAIIDNLEINFRDGFTVLTGETGAGKSIVINAIDFLLGARTSSEMIRNSSLKAEVEGVFIVPKILYFEKIEPWLKKNSFDCPDNYTLVISRELTSSGSKVRINGSLSNISHLLFIRENLINIHEQNEHIELLKPRNQLFILDSFGGRSHKELISEYKKLFDEYRSVQDKLNHYLEHKAELEKKADFLRFQLNEIKSADIGDLNEENILISKRKILLNQQELINNTTLIHELISSDNENSLLFNLNKIKKLLLKSQAHDDAFKANSESIENIINEIKELSSFVNSYKENIELSTDELSSIEERLDLFYHLKKKYGGSLSDIQDYLLKIQQELSQEENSSFSHKELEELHKTKEKEVIGLAEKITKSREEITKIFVNEINEELLTLGFKEVMLIVEFLNCELSKEGKEEVQFLFTANPDEPPKPLLKAISGGELSRVMLAIKSITGAKDTGEFLTMVFDEVDIGVSGEIAASVAKKLYKISKQNQVICITHQPIICAMADNHFVIEKKVSDSETHVTVKEVLHAQKAEAIATLLTPEKSAQENITSDAKQFAASLLENARKIKELAEV